MRHSRTFHCKAIDLSCNRNRTLVQQGDADRRESLGVIRRTERDAFGRRMSLDVKMASLCGGNEQTDSDYQKRQHIFFKAQMRYILPSFVFVYWKKKKNTCLTTIDFLTRMEVCKPQNKSKVCRATSPDASSEPSNLVPDCIPNAKLV